MQWNRENIRELLETNDKAVLRGILVIYSLQTFDEQATRSTTKYNGVGFSGVDAEFMSSLAESIQKYGRLTDKQMTYARKKIKKYAKQLAKVANGELEAHV